MPTQWFVRSKEKVFGPYAASDLKRLAESGKIGPATQVANASEGPWLVAGKIRGLFSQQPSGASEARPVQSGGESQPGIAALRALCSDVDAKDFYIPSDLTPKQLAKVCQAFSIASAESLVGLLDASGLKTGTRGIAICTDGIRWKNEFYVETTKSYLPWEEFQPITPVLTKEKHIDFGNAMVADISETAFPLLDVLPLLCAIKNPQSASRPESARAPQSPRRARRLRFAYKAAAGATLFGLILCMLAGGLAYNFFWPKEKIVEKIVYVEKQQPPTPKREASTAASQRPPVAPRPAPPPPSSTPTQAATTQSYATPKPPPAETPEQRLTKKLMGQWSGTWRSQSGESGLIRIFFAMDDSSSTPRPVARFQTTGMEQGYGDSPFTSERCLGFEGTLIKLNAQNKQTGNEMLFSLNIDAAGQELSGEIISYGISGGLGRVTLQRE